MQNPRDCNMASSPFAGSFSQGSSLVVSPPRKSDWAARSSSCLAQWLLSSSPKSFSSACETSSSGTSLSSAPFVTWRRVFSFLDRFRAIHGTNLCLYDFHLWCNLLRADLNIQIGCGKEEGHEDLTYFFLRHYRLTSGLFIHYKIKNTINVSGWGFFNRITPAVQDAFMCRKTMHKSEGGIIFR